MLSIQVDKPLVVAVVKAIQGGDIPRLKRLLAESPGLASARMIGRGNSSEARQISRTLLHVVADWPSHFPNGAATVAILVAAGADVNARFTGLHTETPLHWAASSDDVNVLDALLDHGADIEAPGAVIGGGAPLVDAVAFGQWRARRLAAQSGFHIRLAGSEHFSPVNSLSHTEL
jgi:hypothetical protein